MTHTQPNRFNNALSIQEGACNPSGIARSLVEACDEARQDPLCYNVSDDAAVRLICHQLAYILGVRAIDDMLDEYGRLTSICQERRH